MRLKVIFLPLQTQQEELGRQRTKGRSVFPFVPFPSEEDLV